MNQENCPCAVNFRYWRDGRLHQLQADCGSILAAQRVVESTASRCAASGLEWLGELFPRLASPIVTGTKFGLAHHRGLL